jgi:hypothetical protein
MDLVQQLALIDAFGERGSIITTNARAADQISHFKIKLVMRAGAQRLSRLSFQPIFVQFGFGQRVCFRVLHVFYLYL